MQFQDIGGIAAWLIEQGLRGGAEADVLAGFCQKCRDAGLFLDRGLALIDTLHPVFEGRAFQWDSQQEVNSYSEYAAAESPEATENWRRSMFFRLRETRERELRRRIGFGDPCDFYNLETLKEAGHTDCVSMIHWFDAEGSIGEMDCFYSNWTTRDAKGFNDDDLYALRKLVPPLALAIKSISVGRIARTIAEVYLGQDAAKQVLEGKISRGKTERISAALWFSDLQNYTRISESAEPEEIIPLLNDYADAVISSVHAAGGNVLKLMGDGILAIFKGDVSQDTCERALLAESLLRTRLKALNDEREKAGRPVTDIYLGLHIGDVFYGNIGSENRLDFTVIGPAVNEVSRIASLCRSVDRNSLVSSDFVEASPPHRREELVSVGRYALRGVKRPQELFTLIAP